MKLTSKARSKIPTSKFAGAGRSYPIEDRGHAIAAKGRAKQQEERGNLTMAQATRIIAKANRKLGR
jgi:hypothetical protein